MTHLTDERKNFKYHGSDYSLKALLQLCWGSKKANRKFSEHKMRDDDHAALITNFFSIHFLIFSFSKKSKCDI